MKNHDGWIIKSNRGVLRRWSFAYTKSEIIRHKIGYPLWKKYKKMGHTIVRVKLVEVKE